MTVILSVEHEKVANQAVCSLSTKLGHCVLLTKHCQVIAVLMVVMIMVVMVVVVMVLVAKVVMMLILL